MSRQTDWFSVGPSIARSAAQKYGLFPEVFVRQIKMESGFNPKAVSPVGARGIAQIMPGTAKGWGVNPDDPAAALDAAAKNMAGYVRTFGGFNNSDPEKIRNAYENALRAYNAGPGAVEASRKYAETNKYVQNILGPINFAQQAQGATQSGQPKQQQATPTSNEFLATFTEHLGKQNELLEALVRSRKESSTQNNDPYGLNNIPIPRPVNPQDVANQMLQSSYSYV